MEQCPPSVESPKHAILGLLFMRPTPATSVALCGKESNKENISCMLLWKAAYT